MASTPASSDQKSFKFDVFLSFRGEDTRTHFVNDLYHALQEKGIFTYKDDKRIKKGERISDELIRSIEESRFYIIVFSKNYASSSWCLDELVKIMKCQEMTEHTAYPVFYHVEPTHVRHQNGAFGDAFVRHKQEEAAERWRCALTEAAGLAGWELKISDGNEDKFIQEVVLDISLKLDSINFSVDENLVGMDRRVEKVLSSLKTSFEDVRMIGIKGMGGGGKTTLAKAIFYHLSMSFEGKSFVENVREVSKGSLSGLKELQKKVLSDVLNDRNFVEQCISNLEVMMRTKMRSRKVLLVLDDVDDKNQLEALAGNCNWFKEGSIIIITTQDEQVLVAHDIHKENIHDVELLLYEEAIGLFNRYVGKSEIPKQRFEELSDKVVFYADGLPLTIKVLGSHLCGRTMCQWEDALQKLKNIPLKKTLDKLKLSYDGLEDDEQQIFLDVACMLKGEMKDEAIRVLKSCEFNAEIGLEVLEQKSLITISKDGRLLLQNNIEEMGRHIVRHKHPREPQKHDRLWVKEEIERILEQELGTEAIRCIKLEGSDLHPSIIMKGLRRMKGLRFLYVDTHFGEVDEVDQHLPNSLQSLHWPGYPLGCLPNTFQANELADLAMVRSSISQLWEAGERKLKFLDLKYSNLRKFDVGTTMNLEMLDLYKCKDFLELYMPFALRRLKFLNLSGSKVCTLNFELTPHLEKLTLSINEDLPDSIYMLKHLKSLVLESSWHLKRLPADICKLECLEELHLADCSDLHDIPDSICKMKCLKSLHLPYVGVKNLPEKLGDIENLKELNIEGAGITKLPDSIREKKGLCIVWSRGRLESYGFTSFTEISKATASCYV